MTRTIAISMPAAPPTNVYVSPSSTNGAVIQDGRAPSAIFTPISRVLSRTTAYMMFATPMPPIRSVRTPMMPRKSSIPSDMFSVVLPLFTVSQVPRTRSSDGS